MEGGENIIRIIEECHMRKLSRNYDELTDHWEYEDYKKNLPNHIEGLLKALKNIENEENYAKKSHISAHLYMLREEINSNGNWRHKNSDSFVQIINEQMCKYNLTNISEDDVEYMISYVHKRLNKTDWKKYPSWIFVYEAIVVNCQISNLEPKQIFPAVLLLIDDFNEENILIGLKIGLKILQSFSNSDVFKEGNYYLVLFKSFKHLFTHKNLEILSLTFQCVEKLLKYLLSIDKNWSLYDTIMSEITSAIYIESNITKKTILLSFLTALIDHFGADSIKFKKIFDKLIEENLDLCSKISNDDYKLAVLNAYKVWLKYCWHIFDYKKDNKQLRLLLKIYTQHKPDEHLNILCKILLINLISLCEQNGQDNLLKYFRNHPQFNKLAC